MQNGSKTVTVTHVQCNLINETGKGKNMKDFSDWDDKFEDKIDHLQWLAKHTASPDRQAEKVLTQLFDWQCDDRLLRRLCFHTASNRYMRRKYEVIVSNIEANDLCDKPYYKDIYEI